MRFIYIYALTGSDGRVRYVGKTNHPKRRLENHLSPSGQQCGNYVRNWIRAERQTGFRVEMWILEACPEDRWEEREKHWIRHGRDLGWNLTNTAPGGKGIGSAAVKAMWVAQPKFKVKRLIAREKRERKRMAHRLVRKFWPEARKSMSMVELAFRCRRRRRILLHDRLMEELRFADPVRFERLRNKPSNAEEKMLRILFGRPLPARSYQGRAFRNRQPISAEAA